MADLRTLINQMRTDGTVARVTTNPLLQFGPTDRPYLGAELLPEQLVEQNEYKEESVKFRSPIANAGDRYSPVQLKKGVLSASFLVTLAHADIGSELRAREFEALQSVLARNLSMEAAAQLLRFLDITVTTPLIEIFELWRWQAIVGALVQARGDNGYTEDIAYANPANHRAAAASTWSVGTNDPFVDIYNRVALLASKGFKVSRIITGSPVVAIMSGNAKVQGHAGHVRVDAGTGNVFVAGGRASRAAINAVLDEDGIPPIEVYDRQYQTSTGTGFFLPRDVMVFVATTGQDQTVTVSPDTMEVLPNTLGHMAVGKVAGASAPGRQAKMLFRDENYPPRIEAEGVEDGLPVILEPEGIATISGIA